MKHLAIAVLLKAENTFIAFHQGLHKRLIQSWVQILFKHINSIFRRVGF